MDWTTFFRAPAQLAPRADLTLIGCGLHSYYQLTAEAISLITQVRAVFYPTREKGLSLFLAALNPAAQPLAEYEIKTFRPDLYRRVAERVVTEAAREPGVALLELGSAVVTNLVTQFALKAAHQRGVSARIVPGVSSIETVLAELGYDPTTTGLQVLQAQRLVLLGQALDASCAALILQPGYYDTLWWAGFPESRADRFDHLAEHLLGFYPAQAEAALVQTPGRASDADAAVLWFRLGNFPRLYRYLTPLHTLFIPPAVAPANDAAFAARIASWDELMGHVELDAGGALPRQHPMGGWHRPDAQRVPPDVLDESRDITRRRAAARG